MSKLEHAIWLVFEIHGNNNNNNKIDYSVQNDKDTAQALQEIREKND